MRDGARGAALKKPCGAMPLKTPFADFCAVPNSTPRLRYNFF
jgi:hypothetical protein